jgi:hypothetical protein
VKWLALVLLSSSCVAYPEHQDVCAGVPCVTELLGRGEDAVLSCLGTPSYIEQAPALDRWIYLGGPGPGGLAVQVRWEGAAVGGVVRWCGP